jgi:hypothetical protein
VRIIRRPGRATDTIAVAENTKLEASLKKSAT